VEEEVKCACVIQSCPGELVELACSVLVHSEADCASRQIWWERMYFRLSNWHKDIVSLS